MNPLEKHNELVIEIVEEIVQSSKETEGDWSALSLVFDLANNRNRRHGFVYYTEAPCNGYSGPKGGECRFKIVELRNRMANGDGRHWHKALVQITSADMNFSIDFEYDDPKRWDVDIQGMISGEYQESLRPKKDED